MDLSIIGPLVETVICYRKGEKVELFAFAIILVIIVVTLDRR